MRYRRSWVPGGTYFFTVNLACRRERLLTAHIDCLRDSVRRVRRAHPFEIVAWVVMPEHMHAVWALPAGDSDFAMRWSQIKGAFSRGLPKTETISMSRVRKRERNIWQRRFWEHLVRDEEDLARHVDYVHYNPVKHGYVERAVDWPFSTFHQYVRRGWLTEDWGCAGDVQGDFGEPR
jgi:putative transposase